MLTTSLIIGGAIIAFHGVCLWKAARECHEQATGQHWPKP